MKEHQRKQKSFSFSWGSGVVVEEAQIITPWHRPTVQLLRYDSGDAQGTYGIRFCQYDHVGRFRRSPLLIRDSDVDRLREALDSTPELKRLLAKLAE